jgi:hypothetical protein
MIIKRSIDQLLLEVEKEMVCVESNQVGNVQRQEGKWIGYKSFKILIKS